MSKRIVAGLRDASGLWKHGHTYQVSRFSSPRISPTNYSKANPLACAASLAVQKVIKDENLLENCRIQGAHLGTACPRGSPTLFTHSSQKNCSRHAYKAPTRPLHRLPSTFAAGAASGESSSTLTAPKRRHWTSKGSSSRCCCRRTRWSMGWLLWVSPAVQTWRGRRGT